jgi:hypothetical protein
MSTTNTQTTVSATGAVKSNKSQAWKDGYNIMVQAFSKFKKSYPNSTTEKNIGRATDIAAEAFEQKYPHPLKDKKTGVIREPQDGKDLNALALWNKNRTEFITGVNTATNDIKVVEKKNGVVQKPTSQVRPK